MNFKDIFQNLNTIWDRQNLRSQSGIKLEQSREYKIKDKTINIFWNTDNIFFCYLTNHTEKITKKFIRDDLLKIEDIKHAKYLVLMLQNEKDPQIVWVDLINKTNPKITTLHIDNKWTFNIDEDKIVYKNRTLSEQFQELQKDLKWWERELKVRFLKKFFEKQKLTESFYAIYKTELFDKIKKDLIKHFGKEDEDVINNFILINLNRLLFIHFLDKKGGVFKSYENKRWSYISYLFHKVYKELDTQEPFYQAVLKPLFFEALNKPYTERKFNHKILNEEFKDLPYLNGWLFNPTTYEKNNTYFIDNVFVKSFIINIIDQFNFTITEDTPFDIKVSVDPELLGYIFENLIQDYDNSKNKKESKKDERSKWGIFYTPKIEVDFMCRQVLIEYLSKKDELKHLKSSLYELFYPEKWTREDQKYGSFNSKEIWFVFKYLEEAKVVDPACGSWAFLVGMMQVILDIENTLLQQNEALIKLSSTPWIKEIKEKNKFQRKKQLIKQSLHWVDIKPWAVEIAKLRLWLSMIIDINESVFQKESVKTQPLLPSFGFKIVQGDSLVNRIGTNLIPIDITRKDILDKRTRDKVEELAKLKNEYYDNKYKDENIVKNKEKEIYESIIESKISKTKKEIKTIEDQKNNKVESTLFGENWEQTWTVTIKVDSKKLGKQLNEYKSILETLQKQLWDISIKWNIPFARGIDFSEVFTEKWGFDVVVGNPPYVWYKAIEDPVEMLESKDYKTFLQKSVYSDYKKWTISINWKSDLYIYFYYKSLSLLNNSWYMAFVTSNMRLDTQYWVDLQEFFCKRFEIIKIFDSSVQTFDSADLNSNIIFLPKPSNKYSYSNKLLFCTFKLPYENSIYTETFLELEKVDNKRLETNESIVVKITWESVYNLWCEEDETGLLVKYVWQKWSNTFMRSRWKIEKILDKVSNKFIKINKIKYLDLLTGIKEWWFKKLLKEKSDLPNLKILSNVKKHNNIIINKYDWVVDEQEYIKKFHKKIANILLISARWQTHKCQYNKELFAFTGNYIWIDVTKEKETDILLLFNSTLFILLTELWSRNKWIWGAAIVMNKMDLLTINIPNPDLFSFDIKALSWFINREIYPIFDELWFDKTKDIRSQIPNPLPDRKELDDIIFDELWLTQEERDEVYRSLAELVKARLDKAKSM